MNPDNNLGPEDDNRPVPGSESAAETNQVNEANQPEDNNIDDSSQVNEVSEATPDAESFAVEGMEDTSTLVNSSVDEPATAQEPEPVVADKFEAPVADNPTEVTPTVPQQKPPKSKKMLIGAIVGLAAILLLGGSAATYALWYQNPQKVVTDAIVNMLKAETYLVDGTVEILNIGDEDTSVNKISLALDGKSTTTTGEMNAKLSIDAEDKTYDLEGSALVDSDANIYFKVKNIKSLTDEMAAESQAASPYVDQLVAKIEDKWIRISADDYKEVSEDASKVQKCFADTMKKYENDSKAQSQIADAYKNNQFIVIEEELGTKDGNIGYAIEGDQDKAKSFANALKETDIYKDLSKCDDSFKIDTDDVEDAVKDDDGTESRLEVWISQFGHELRQTKASLKTDEASVEAVLNTQFNQEVSVSAPTDFVTIKDLMEDINNIIMEQMMNNYGGSANGATLQYGTATPVET